MKKNSTSGTPNTELSALEICRIIRECARSGVKDFSLGPLQLSFGPEGKLGLQKRVSSKSSLASPPETPQTSLLEAEPKEVQASSPERELIEQFRDTQQLLEDPVGFEDQLIDEDLEEEGVLGRGVNADEEELNGWGSQQAL